MKKVMYYIISWTWGLPMTLMGAVVALILLVTGHKPQHFYYNTYFEVGEHWGGLEAGMFFFKEKNKSLHIKQHEAGHGIQNLILGPFMPIIVSIPSAIRYWYRIIKVRHNPNCVLPPYDSMWFEGWATKLGEKYFK